MSLVGLALAMGGTAVGPPPAMAGAGAVAVPDVAVPERPPTPSPNWLRGLHWVNAAPVVASRLQGKVVLVEFWTFDCINCRRTIPAMHKLAATHAADSSLVILGIHTPELDWERDASNVRDAVKRYDLRFPVAQDNDYAAWRAFGNQYWPCLYLLDGSGHVRWMHVGELHEDTMAWRDLAAAIVTLERRGA